MSTQIPRVKFICQTLGFAFCVNVMKYSVKAKGKVLFVTLWLAFV